MEVFFQLKVAKAQSMKLNGQRVKGSNSERVKFPISYGDIL